MTDSKTLKNDETRRSELCRMGQMSVRQREAMGKLHENRSMTSRNSREWAKVYDLVRPFIGELPNGGSNFLDFYKYIKYRSLYRYSHWLTVNDLINAIFRFESESLLRTVPRIDVFRNSFEGQILGPVEK